MAHGPGEAGTKGRPATLSAGAAASTAATEPRRTRRSTSDPRSARRRSAPPAPPGGGGAGPGAGSCPRRRSGGGRAPAAWRRLLRGQRAGGSRVVRAATPAGTRKKRLCKRSSERRAVRCAGRPFQAASMRISRSSPSPWTLMRRTAAHVGQLAVGDQLHHVEVHPEREPVHFTRGRRASSELMASIASLPGHSAARGGSATPERQPGGANRAGSRARALANTPACRRACARTVSRGRQPVASRSALRPLEDLELRRPQAAGSVTTSTLASVSPRRSSPPRGSPAPCPPRRCTPRRLASFGREPVRLRRVADVHEVRRTSRSPTLISGVQGPPRPRRSGGPGRRHEAGGLARPQC